MKITINIEIEGDNALDTLRNILGSPTEPAFVKVAKSVLDRQVSPKKSINPFHGTDTALLMGVWNNAESAQEVCDYYGAQARWKASLQNKVTYLRKHKKMKFKYFNNMK